MFCNFHFSDDQSLFKISVGEWFCSKVSHCPPPPLNHGQLLEEGQITTRDAPMTFSFFCLFLHRMPTTYLKHNIWRIWPYLSPPNMVKCNYNVKLKVTANFCSGVFKFCVGSAYEYAALVQKEKANSKKICFFGTPY